MDECPINVTCRMHHQAANWLIKGQLEKMRLNMDVIETLSERAWKRCECNLFNRILMALNPETPVEERHGRIQPIGLYMTEDEIQYLQCPMRDAPGHKFLVTNLVRSKRSPKFLKGVDRYMKSKALDDCTCGLAEKIKEKLKEKK